MDLNVSVKVPAIEKLLDLAASGMGATFGAYLKPWIAGREAEALRQLAQGKADSMRIMAQAQVDSRTILLPTEADSQGEISFSTMVEHKVLYQEEKRTQNALTVAQQAAYELGDEEVPDIEPDHDWTAQFFAAVQDVSSEEMKVLWAKVLADQVRSPGNTSIKTLDILKTLDVQTASLFQRFSAMCISLRSEGEILDSRVPHMGGLPGDNCLQEYGLDYNNLVNLEEYGLIVSDYESWLDYQECVIPGTVNAPSAPFNFQGRNWMLESLVDRNPGEFRVEGVALTGSGRELSRAVEVEVIDPFSQALMKYLTTRNMRMIQV